MKKRIVILVGFLLIGESRCPFGIKFNQGPNTPKPPTTPSPSHLPTTPRPTAQKPTNPAPVSQPSPLKRSNAINKKPAVLVTSSQPSPLKRSGAIKEPTTPTRPRPEFTNPVYDPKAVVPESFKNPGLNNSASTPVPVKTAPTYSVPQKPVVPALPPRLSQTPPLVDRKNKPTAQSLPPALSPRSAQTAPPLPSKPAGAPAVDRTNKPLAVVKGNTTSGSSVRASLEV